MHLSSQRGLLAVSMCHMSLSLSVSHALSNTWYSVHVSKNCWYPDQFAYTWAMTTGWDWKMQGTWLEHARLVMWQSMRITRTKPAKSHFSSTSARIQTLWNGGIWLDPRSISSSQNLICLPFFHKYQRFFFFWFVQGTEHTIANIANLVYTQK